MAPAKRWTLRRFTRPERTIPWLALRALRPWTGRTETLWREQALLGGLAWRHCAELRKRLHRRATRRRATARAAAGASRGHGRLPCPPWRCSRRLPSPNPPGHRRGL